MHPLAPGNGVAVSSLKSSPALSAPRLVEILQSLVRTKSVNPGTSEGAMADVIVRWLETTSAHVSRVEFSPGRPSIAAVLNGSADGPAVVLNGHMDTVPIDDEQLWTTDPFGGEIRDGFVYGRGACDMKAGLAVQIGVAQYFSGLSASRRRGTLVLHFAAGEELGEPGTLSLLNAGFGGDYGITTEPTDLRVATATRGCAHYSIRIKGQSIHASQADLGSNPIWALGRVLEVLKDYDQGVRRHKHPLLPGGSCTPTVIRAGVTGNAVPDECELLIDRRLLPGETVETERAVLTARLEELRTQDPTLEFEVSPQLSVDSAEIDANSSFARRVLAAARAVTGQHEEVWGAPFGSDVRNLVNDAGIEAVTFGPGNVSECHCANERVSITQLEDSALTIAKVVTDLLVAEE